MNTKMKKQSQGCFEEGTDLPGPTIVASLQNIPIRKIFSGPLANHSAAVTSIGEVYMWGANECGQLGLGHTTTQSAPVLLKSLRGKVSYVAVEDVTQYSSRRMEKCLVADQMRKGRLPVSVEQEK